MPDFQTQPALSDLYTTILQQIRDKDVALAKKDYTGWTNLPTGAIRANSSNNYKHERWNGSAWVLLDFHTTIDNHIANSSIHEARHTGSLEFIAYATPDSGWLICDGTAVSRTTYSTLFAKIGTAYGAGDGSTTFNLPDMRGRLAIGVNTGIVAINALGKTAGSFDHTHSTPNHAHSIASHTHTMGNHTHTIGSHSHSIPNHAHNVPAHHHYVTANGGDINITSSGSHTHNYGAKEGGSNGSGANRPQGASSSTGSNVTYATGTTNSDHVHGSGNFGGRVGNVYGYNGDGSFPTDGSGTLYTDGSGAYGSGGPSTNTTDGSGTLSTDTSGGGTTGTGNPPVLCGYWQIKV